MAILPVLKKLKCENVPTFEVVLQEYKDKFYHSLYSLVAKAIISDDPSQQSLETMADDPLRKLRNPLINQELRTIVKLFEEYGTLDTTETEESWTRNFNPFATNDYGFETFYLN